MTTIEYILNFALIGLVLLQIRGRKITVASLLVPVAITAWVAMNFLHAIPTAGNDLTLEIAGTLAGAALGALAAVATSISRDGAGLAVAKAGALAALLWIVGVGARVGFSLFVQHGGQHQVASFSLAHHITSGHAWGAAFVLMAIAEVAARTGVVYLKARRAGAVIPRRATRQAALAA